ncbi:hypothetical protein LWI29_017682 [Acer saccharum]|uniref:Uncharacterized protein n=1 Tax=Acer saccharum TaxID=4024 RepID=A0AA39VBW4_ACESA|nr:hypothetical protein LWI29_017682 [Acer saccharum]
MVGISETPILERKLANRVLESGLLTIELVNRVGLLHQVELQREKSVGQLWQVAGDSRGQVWRVKSVWRQQLELRMKAVPSTWKIHAEPRPNGSEHE